VLLGIWAIVRAGRRPRWAAIATVAIIAIPGLLSLRGMYWWGMSAPVLVAEAGVLRDRSPREDPTGVHAAVVVGMLLLALLGTLVRWIPHTDQVPPPASMLTYAPQAVTRELRGILEPDEPFFNAQLWGSWFEFALQDNPVFADSRIEVIPPSAWADYLAISAARPGWRSILDRWGLRVLAIRNDQQGPLISALATDPDWAEVFRGDGGSVFVRSTETG